MKTMNRWGIAVAGVFLQIALGAVYAWSAFCAPLARQFGWSISEITLTFTIGSAGDESGTKIGKEGANSTPEPELAC